MFPMGLSGEIGKGEDGVDERRAGEAVGGLVVVKISHAKRVSSDHHLTLAGVPCDKLPIALYPSERVGFKAEKGVVGQSGVGDVGRQMERIAKVLAIVEPCIAGPRPAAGRVGPEA